jgi:hypothetical protein
MERTAVASVLPLESARFLHPQSLCNYASAVDHAQPLRPRCQAIKYTPPYHCLTHTWGLRLKKLLDRRSGASPFRPTLGGFALSTRAQGLRPFDPRSGASPLCPTLGGSALRRTLGGFTPSTYARGLHPFDLRTGALPFGVHSGAPPIDLHDSSKFAQNHSEESSKIHTYTRDK